MKSRHKNILKAGWELVVALFVFAGTFFMAFAKMFLSNFNTESEKDDTDFNVEIENGFLVSKSNNVTIPLEDLDNKS